MDRTTRGEPDGRCHAPGEDRPTGPSSVLLVRHAETAWSKAGRHTGRSDVPLSPEGRMRAVELRERLGSARASRVFSSPLSRALETCSLAGFGDRVEILEGLAEWDYGDFEGRTTAEIRTEHPSWRLFYDGCPHGERLEDVARRVDRVMAAILATDACNTVIVFSHGHLLRVLTASWLGLASVEGRHFAIAPGAIGELGYEREERALLRWNA